MSEQVRDMKRWRKGGRGPNPAGLAPGSGRLAWLGRFRADRRGGTAVQAIVMMPVVILALMSAIRVWQVIQIRDSLHTGTYLAMRYLSLYPAETNDPYIWSEIAEQFVFAELRNNPWVDDRTLISGSPLSKVEVELLRGSYDCTDPFVVRTNYAFRVLGGDLTVEGWPGLLQLDLHDERQGEVLCR